ncbi:MAG: hypothetical protein NTW86_22880 [Candidatus Sumerlaeota bacterium]|nr:hypothetical protein [Candidatus Sumerlaeota bacterium]
MAVWGGASRAFTSAAPSTRAPPGIRSPWTAPPGRFLSQGIFPAVGLHNAKVGIAAGLAPMDIESFYGSRVRPAAGPLETFYYAVRLAIPPHSERRVTFVLYATDPNWSWRSVVDRYWSFWPALFDAPKRDVVWGLYGLVSTPKAVLEAGDKFIDLCRRLRVGAMELSAPFARTGDFYAEGEPAYSRKAGTLNRDQLRRAYEIADQGCCNLSYVIPLRCERQLAHAKFSDSIMHESNGKFFERDDWDVLSNGKEKMSAMFAWGDSFGEHVRNDLHRIIEDYRPCGFYLDLGALVTPDYGRMTEWAAFDDEGRVYTTAGVAYAKLLDDLRQFAPGVQRNPGEEIQYFTGFRAQSKLSNHTDRQPFYIRSHRLIMGRKPIYPGIAKLMSKPLLNDSLEFGGLPFLAMFMDRKKEALSREWGPVAVALARAGWRPMPEAVANSPSARIQRFGRGAETFFTVRNLSGANLTVALKLGGLYPRLCEFRNRAPLEPKVDEATSVTAVTLTIPASELVVLRAEPAPGPLQSEWPKARFLAQAAPLSIIAPGVPAAQRIARAVKGFVELQAELMEKMADVEIVADAAKARFSNRISIRMAPNPALAGDGPNGMILSGPDEASMRRLLGEYLETIELPLGKEKPMWTLATPAPSRG